MCSSAWAIYHSIRLHTAVLASEFTKLLHSTEVSSALELEKLYICPHYSTFTVFRLLFMYILYIYSKNVMHYCSLSYLNKLRSYTLKYCLYMMSVSVAAKFSPFFTSECLTVSVWCRAAGCGQWTLSLELKATINLCIVKGSYRFRW